MDYGINLATAADSWKVVKRAEELGFTRAWFYDTQLLNAEIFDNFVITDVPEPASLSLLALGAIGLVSRRRR